ncbi:UV excision repair protein RAD23, partial [Lecanoromycetidae sp. Uapishka_2]
MKLTFKDLKQQKFVIDAEPSETIGEVKEKISKEKGWEAGQQKLIYSGKILQDANTVESYSIEEKGFIVCMVSKPKAAPAASSSAPKAPSTPAPVPAQTPAAPAAPAPASNTTASNAPATPSPAPSAPSAEAATFNDPSALTLGSQREEAIVNMESMGFARAEIDRAMRAAFFNPDRAVEYLLNGIPDNVQQEQAQVRGATAGPPAGGTQAAASPAPATGNIAEPATAGGDGDEPVNLFEAAAEAGRAGGAGGAARGRGAGATGSSLAGLGAGIGAAAGAEGGAGLGNLDFLRNNPQFQQLRQIVQTQPRMLEPILQQVGAGNPQLARLIGENPDQFLQLLSEDTGEDTPLPPGAQEISVTEEEREAIERLCRLGFERDMVIQAYFACDKNEELAANFLFDQPDDGDEGGAA